MTSGRAGKTKDPVRAAVSTATRPKTSQDKNPAPLPFVNVVDADEVRAARTASLIKRLAPNLGLATNSFEIRLDEEARRRTSARGARGLVTGRRVFLDADHYDPGNATGRYLLAHELAHVAQIVANRPMPGSLRTTVQTAELEADLIGRQFSEREIVIEPRASLSAGISAADNDSPASLGDVVRDSRRLEISRISELLEDESIGGGDAEQVLRILEGMTFAVGQEVMRAVGKHSVEKLAAAIDAVHFKRFRSQILSCYQILDKQSLRNFDEKLFEGMDFYSLSENEFLATRHVLENLPSPAVLALRRDLKSGDTVAAIKNRPLESGQAFQDRDALNRIVLEEQQLAQARNADDAGIWMDVEEIRSRLKRRWTDFVITDEEALETLDILKKYERDKFRLQAIVFRLEKEELLETLINELPVQKLFDGTTHYRKTLLRILTFRSPDRNVTTVEKLLSRGDLMIDDEEAFLAFQIVKALPPHARSALLEAEEGKYEDRLFGEMSRSQRESLSTNFYSGIRSQYDLASIQGQILDDTLWALEKRGHLSGLIRMAIASGEHEWVFKQSKHRSKERPDIYFEPTFYRDIVEAYSLYDEKAGRTEFVGEQLEGLKFGQEGFLGWIDDKIIGGLSFLAGGESEDKDVELQTLSIGGKDLDVVRFQKILGGHFFGIRFTEHSAIDKQEWAEKHGQTQEQLKKINSLRDVKWDWEKGAMTLDAPALDIAAIHYPLDNLKIEAGRSKIKGLRLHIQYSSAENPQPTAIEASIDTLELNDLLLISVDSMQRIRQVDVRRWGLRSDSGTHAELTEPRGGSDIWSYLLVRIPRLLNLFGRLDELTTGLKTPNTPMALFMSVGTVTLNGITTSSGQHIESLDIQDLSLEVGAPGEEEALRQREQRLQQMIDDEKNKEKRPLLEKHRDLIRLQLGQIEHAEGAVASLELKQRTDGLTDDERERLREAKAQLASFKGRGAFLQAGSVALKGVSGTTSVDDFTIENLIGRSQQSAGALAFLSEAESLHRFIRGPDYRPLVTGSHDPASFVFDVGDVDLHNLDRKASVPTPYEVEKEIEAVRLELKKYPRNIDLLLAEQSLRLKHRSALRYMELAEIGVSHFTDEEQHEFLRLRKLMLDASAWRAGEVAIKGGQVTLTGTAGQGAAGVEKLGFKADLIDVFDLYLADANAEVDWLTGEDLDVALDTSGKGQLDVRASAIVAFGFSTAVTEQALMQELKLLETRPRPSEADQLRIASLQEELEMLYGFRDLLMSAKIKIEDAADDPEKLHAAQEEFRIVELAYQEWRRRVSAEGIALRGVDARVTGLGNVLSEDFDLDKALKAGITVEGAGPDGRIVEQVAGEGLRFPGLTIDDAQIAGISGKITLTDKEVTVTDLRLESLQSNGFDFFSDELAVTAGGKTDISGIRLTATAKFKDTPAGPEFDDLHIREFRAETASAAKLSVDIAGREAEIATGQTKADEKHVDIDNAALSGLFVRDFHLKERKGSVQAKSADVGSLAVHVGEYVERNLVAEASIHATDIGAIIVGPDQIALTVGSARGAVKAKGVTSRLAVEDLEFWVRQGEGFIEVSGVHLDKLDLEKTRYSTPEWSFSLAEASAQHIHLDYLRFNFVKREKKGQLVEELESVLLDGLTIERIETGAIDYLGPLTHKERKKNGGPDTEVVSSRIRFSAADATLAKLDLDGLDMDLLQGAIDLDLRRISSLDVNQTQLVLGSLVNSQKFGTVIRGDLFAREMSAALQFRSLVVDGKKQLKTEGDFTIGRTGLKSAHVVNVDEQGTIIGISARNVAKPSGLEASGVTGVFGKDDAFRVGAADITAKNLEVRFPDGEISIVVGSIKDAIVASKGRTKDELLSNLAISAREAAVKGLNVDWTMHRAAPAGDEGAREDLILEPLDGANGYFEAAYVFKGFPVRVFLPVENGVVDLDSVTIADQPTWGLFARDGGIWLDVPALPGPLNKQLVEGPLPGLHEDRGESGQIVLRELVEGRLNEPGNEPPQPMDILNDLGITESRLSLGGGRIGTESNYVNFGGVLNDENWLDFVSNVLGQQLVGGSRRLTREKLSGQVTLKTEEGSVTKKFETGQARIENLFVSISGLAGLHIRIQLLIKDNVIQDIEFGNASALDESFVQPSPTALKPNRSRSDDFLPIENRNPAGRQPPSEDFDVMVTAGDEDVHVLFEQDKFALSASGASKLWEFLAEKSLPVVVDIHGYASEEGNADYNDNLSAHRAVAVEKYISKIMPEGSETNVYAHGETDDFGSRDQNRRVGVDILEGVRPSLLWPLILRGDDDVELRPPSSKFNLGIPELSLSNDFPELLPPRLPGLSDDLKLPPNFFDFSLRLPPEPDWAGLNKPFSVRGLRINDRDQAAIEQLWLRNYRWFSFLGTDWAKTLADKSTAFAYDKQLSVEHPNFEDLLTQEEERLDIKTYTVPIITPETLDWSRKKASKLWRQMTRKKKPKKKNEEQQE